MPGEASLSRLHRSITDGITGHHFGIYGRYTSAGDTAELRRNVRSYHRVNRRRVDLRAFYHVRHLYYCRLSLIFVCNYTCASVMHQASSQCNCISPTYRSDDLRRG